MIYFIKEYEFTDALGTFIPTDYTLPTGTFRYTSNGVVLRDGLTYGYITVPFTASKSVEVVAGALQYSGHIWFRLKDSDGNAYKYASGVIFDTWEIDPTNAVWEDGDNFHRIGLIPSDLAPNFSIEIKFDSTTLLNEMIVLYAIDMDDYWYYTHTQFDNFLKATTFIGRLVINSITSEATANPAIFQIPIEEVTPSGGYNSIQFYSVKHGTEEILSSVDTNYMYVTEELTDEAITIYYTYTCNTKINQGMDFLEIDSYPTLVVDDFTVTPQVEDPYSIAVWGAQGHGVKKLYKVQTQRGVQLDFNLIVCANLYYDTMAIWEKLFSTNFSRISLDEIGSCLLVEITNPTRETVSLGSEGGRVLYSRITLRYPYPVKVEAADMVETVTVSSFNGNDSWSTTTTTTTATTTLTTTTEPPN